VLDEIGDMKIPYIEMSSAFASTGSAIVFELHRTRIVSVDNVRLEKPCSSMNRFVHSILEMTSSMTISSALVLL